MTRDTGAPPPGAPVGQSACGGDCAVCARLRSALRAMLDNHGWHEATASTLATAAGIDTVALCEHYPSTGACGAAALDEAATECLRACVEACDSFRGWRDRFVDMARTLLHWSATRPDMARMLFVVPDQACEPQLLTLQATFKRQMVALFDPPEGGSSIGRVHAEFALGVLFHLLRGGLMRGVPTDALRRRVSELALLVPPQQ